MPYVADGAEQSTTTDLYREDQANGQPVAASTASPDGHSWEKQTAALLDADYRVIAYDRRGFGQSSRPSTGCDHDIFAAGIDKVLGHCDRVAEAAFLTCLEGAQERT